MSRFCRHNRFVERCPICRETVPGLEPAAGSKARSRARSPGSKRAAGARKPGLRVYVEGARRGEDDGYRSELVPGLRSFADAEALAAEVAFASARLMALTASPPGLYAEARALEADLEQATWLCFLTSYLSPLQDGEDPFAGIRQALATIPAGRVPDWRAGKLPDLEGVALGPRSSHDPAHGTSTISAYLQWAERAGSQERAFAGDAAWTRPRRFERLFERLTLPGFGRMGRYDLLVTLGRLGLYEMRADSLHLAGVGGAAASDLTTLAAKRMFGIGDPLHLDRRALALAKELAVSVEVLDLAHANWGAGERATLGFPADLCDTHALERARDALEL